MKLFLSTKASKQLTSLPIKISQIVLAEVRSLHDNPFPINSKKLVNRQGWRMRIGDYRILYTVDKLAKEVTVLSVAHRKDAYRH